jgi:hypothetical protein
MAAPDEKDGGRDPARDVPPRASTLPERLSQLPLRLSELPRRLSQIPMRLSQMPFPVRRDGPIVRRVMAVCLVGVGGALAVALTGWEGTRALLRRAHVLPQAVVAPEPVVLPTREARPLTIEDRQRGFHECMPPDRGYGAYAPWRSLSMGRLLLPQKGGHTDDMGFDVLVHFHGQDPVRKTLVHVARGIAFVGIDLGNGSGAYDTAFPSAAVYTTLRESIVRELRAHTGDERAHIRHLALSSWSAGYGAVNAILRNGADDVDAVVLLDSLHASFDPRGPRNGRVESVTDIVVAPTFAFAERAAKGQGTLFMTYSHVDPVQYPSTSLTAAFLMQKLALEPPTPVTDGPPGPHRLESRLDAGGIHLRQYAGRDEAAHCDHTTHIAEAVRDVLEPAWNTPPMDLTVAAANIAPSPIPRKGR